MFYCMLLFLSKCNTFVWFQTNNRDLGARTSFAYTGRKLLMYSKLKGQQQMSRPMGRTVALVRKKKKMSPTFDKPMLHLQYPNLTSLLLISTLIWPSNTPNAAGFCRTGRGAPGLPGYKQRGYTGMGLRIRFVFRL